MEKPSSPPPDYTEDYTLRSVDCGADGIMRVDAAFEILQEAAGYHAELCGAGFLDLLPTGRTWILSRIRVDFLRPARYGDVLSVKTWPRGTQGLLALRDFRVRGADGEILMLGTSSWLLVEVAGRRPLRVADYLAGRFILTDEKVLGADAAKLADFPVALGDGSPTADARRSAALDFLVRASDLDMNGHMTNTAYFKMLSDGLAEAYPSFTPSSVEANFMAEAFRGDALSLAFAPADGASVGSPGQDGAPRGAKLIAPEKGKEYVRFGLR
jgi:medium-chain acyl-[acyl-carrier-protein] hydrolase